jgi:hypothetical protein
VKDPEEYDTATGPEWDNEKKRTRENGDKEGME